MYGAGDRKHRPRVCLIQSVWPLDEIRRADIAYRTLADRAKTINGVYEERMLANLLCYMFNTICGLFNTISAHRTEGTPAAAVAAHLLWVVNCAGRITVVCFAASSVVDQVRSDGRLSRSRYIPAVFAQDDRLHDSVHVARATLGDCSEVSDKRARDGVGTTFKGRTYRGIRVGYG